MEVRKSIFQGETINIMICRTLLRLCIGGPIGVLGGIDIGQQTRLEFCIGRFGSILVDQKQHK